MSEEAPSALGEVEEGLQERFSNLNIEGLIARGGMGAVYRAVQTQLDRPVALKILPDEFAADEVRRNLFVREARAMAKLSHPHLVQLFDFGENEGLWFMVQEWVAGKTLFDHQQAGVLEIDDGVRIVREVCAGLQHAHEHGVVHRDIKPANILIDPDGAVKLTDFGLAQSVGGDASASEEEDSFGTPEYAAPELFEEGAEIDHRADIFAVGVLLFELLTGQQPAAVYQPPSEVISDLGTRFDAIISKAMQHNPEDRYDSCAAFDQDLYNALTGAEAEASKPKGPKVLTGAVPVAGGATIGATGLTSLASAKSGGGIGQLLGVLVGIGVVVGGFIYIFKGDGPEEKKDDNKVELISYDDEPRRKPKAASVNPSSKKQANAGGSESLKQSQAVKKSESKKPKKRKDSKPDKSKVTKKKKAPIGEITELTAIEEGYMRKAPALIEVYDREMKILRGKYLNACKNAARKNRGLANFWKEEAKAFEDAGSPPENDDGVPDRALALRTGWRTHQQKSAQALKLLHIDTLERLDLLVKEFQRGSEMRKVRKVSERATAMRTFDYFLETCREKMAK